MKTHAIPLICLSAVMIFGLSACGTASQSEATAPENTRQAPVPVAEATLAETHAGLPECVLPLPGPEEWPVFICDSFNGTHKTFPDESQDNPYARYSAQITDGQFYEVDYTAKAYAQFQRSSLTWFDIANTQDFALSINGTMNSKFKDVSWGIGFRGSEDKGSYFLFSIFNDGTYTFEIYENDGWISLISKRPFNGIRLGQTNVLNVKAEGKNFSFKINGEPVEGFEGGLLEGMQVFLVVSAKEGASVVFSFDNLVLQI